MNFEQLLEKSKDEIKTDAIKKMIVTLRSYKINDKKIYESLVHDYGDDFSEDELKHLLQITK